MLGTEVWPNGGQFEAAVSTGPEVFTDARLRAAQFDRDDYGAPVQVTGESAVVFFGSATGDTFVLRCPTRQLPGGAERYSAVTNHLRRHRVLSAFPKAEWVEKGVRVGEKWWPVVVMDQVAGTTLRTYLRRHLDEPDTLRGLADDWRHLLGEMSTAEIAHGDLQHGNIFVTERGLLRLVDLDSVWVPATAHLRPDEHGHRHYQHPRRQPAQYWDRHVDTFPGLVIYLSLLAVAADPGLWEEFHRDENLIFSAADLAQPDQTPIWTRLAASRDPAVRRFVPLLRRFCLGPPAISADLPTLLRDPESALADAPSSEAVAPAPGAGTSWWQDGSRSAPTVPIDPSKGWASPVPPGPGAAGAGSSGAGSPDTASTHIPATPPAPAPRSAPSTRSTAAPRATAGSGPGVPRGTPPARRGQPPVPTPPSTGPVPARSGGSRSAAMLALAIIAIILVIAIIAVSV